MISRREFLARLLGVAAVITAATAGPADPMIQSDGTLPHTSGSFGSDPTFEVGDVFTIEGKYALNPVTLQSTERLQQFVVTDVTTAGEIVADPAAHIWPVIRSGGLYPTVSDSRPFRARDIRPIAWGPPLVPCNVSESWQT